MDDHNRDVLAIEIDLSLSAPWVARVLYRLVERHGYQKQLHTKNCLEFMKSGELTQNSYVERLNRTFREEILEAYIIQSLAEVREPTQAWLDQYNGERAHTAPGRVTPLDC